MALTTCPECGSQVSDKALFRPHCGLPRELRGAFPGREAEQAPQAGAAGDPAEKPKERDTRFKLFSTEVIMLLVLLLLVLSLAFKPWWVWVFS